MPHASHAIIDLYDRNARLWDESRGRALMERAWLDRFAAMLPKGAAILDIGCGAGDPIARHLLDRGFLVTGLDSSPALIAIARERLPTGEWIVGDMRDLALGHRFDGLLAWHSSFHLTAGDQRALFPRFAAHALPGTMLMFTSGSEAGEAIGSFAGEPLYHASLGPEEYRALLADNGFAVTEMRIGDSECGGATVWLARFEGQINPASGLDGSA